MSRARPEPVSADRLAKVVEAMVCISDGPVSAAQLAQATGNTEEDVAASLDELAQFYDRTDRGFMLDRVAGGWQLRSRPELHDDLTPLVAGEGAARLSAAAIETLAIVAYRGPISRARVSAIRGVNVDGVMRTLQSRGLITEVPHDSPGIGMLYATTPYFLECMGLDTLDELPPLAPHLPDGSELDDLAGDMA